jgi:hypothetical protein
MISTKDKKFPTTMPKRLTGNSFTPMKSPIGRVTDFWKDPVSFLQRQLGNSFLQAKLKVSQPNDKYEEEADRIADLVMQMPEPEVLRQPEEEEEEELIQSKPLVEQITPLVQRQTEEEEEEELLQTKLETDAQHSVQRQPEEEGEEEELVQPKKGAGHTGEVNSNFGAQISKLIGGGQPLPESVRTFFESYFHNDFGGVRIHNNEEAAAVAGVLNAQAFTIGKDIVFGSSKYSPNTPSGRKLLAHELTHVVQQTKYRQPSHVQLLAAETASLIVGGTGAVLSAAGVIVPFIWGKEHIEGIKFPGEAIFSSNLSYAFGDYTFEYGFKVVSEADLYVHMVPWFNFSSPSVESPETINMGINFDATKSNRPFGWDVDVRVLRTMDTNYEVAVEELRFIGNRSYYARTDEKVRLRTRKVTFRCVVDELGLGHWRQDTTVELNPHWMAHPSGYVFGRFSKKRWKNPLANKKKYEIVYGPRVDMP